MENHQLINQFYSAFQKLDAEGMIACYHHDILFSDPAFGEISGNRARAMWRMLCKNAVDFRLEFSNVQADEKSGSANWEAWYTFSQTKRSVHNIISARFEFKDGLIIQHTDSFNLKRWAGQALGAKGHILGGTGFFRKKLQSQTNHRLDQFIKTHSNL
ncbi:MAG: nuclear transport factor 2 family protein [Calditrichaeota bacterium]|nr:nuclear transport factor 2 family protein [Calditrichota bacterium]